MGRGARLRKLEAPLVTLALSLVLLGPSGDCRSRDCSGNPPAGFNLQGSFIGLTQGDYFHWEMRDTCGNVRSFWMLNPKPSVLGTLESPDLLAGKRCSIAWRRTELAVSEDGGRVHRVDEITDVVWHD